VAEFFGFGKDRSELFSFPENPQKGPGFIVRQADEAQFGENDGPGKDGKEQEDEEDGFHHRARVKDQIHDAPSESSGRPREELP
jgi:hypothetical protein